MSALHCGHFTVVYIASWKKLFSGFFEVSINCLFDNLVPGKKKLLFWKKGVEKVLNFSCIPKSVRSNMATSSKMHECYVFVDRDNLSFALGLFIAYSLTRTSCNKPKVVS